MVLSRRFVSFLVSSCIPATRVTGLCCLETVGLSGLGVVQRDGIGIFRIGITAGPWLNPIRVAGAALCRAQPKD